MRFQDIIGQQETADRLVQMYRQHRLGHALLFLGPEGSGALSLAIAFAGFLLCEKNQPGKPAAASGALFDEPLPEQSGEPLTDACGNCAACQKTARFIHPDLHFTYPVIPKKSGDKPISTEFITEWRSFLSEQPYGNRFDWLQHIGAENQQGNITAHECHEIIRKMSLKSFESPYKLLIIWLPELLGNDGNRLLKLLEEPPPNTLFILVAENQSLILPTILSRVQLIKIPRLDDAVIQKALMEKENLPADQAGRLATLSEGNYREALQGMQHADHDWLALLRTWLNETIRNQREGQLVWIENVSKLGREKQKQFLLYFSHLIDIAIRVQVLGSEAPGIDSAHPDTVFALKLNRQMDLAQMEAISREIDQSIFHIERNANAKILFHALTIRLYHIISNKSIILVS